jgi:DNA-binding response OmpR family regulator
MIEVEQPEGLSARKLVLETAKHNVLTAYSGDYGMELLHRFPNVDLVVVHRYADGEGAEEIIRRIKEHSPKMPIVLLSPNPDEDPLGANFIIPSHTPQMILDLLENSFGASGTND